MIRNYLRLFTLLLIVKILTGCNIKTQESVMIDSNKVTAIIPPERATLLWEISGNGLKKCSYLFGTSHLAKASLILGSPLFSKLLDSADAIAIESLPDESFKSKMTWKDFVIDEPLSSLLSPIDYNEVSDLFWQKLNLKLEKQPHYYPIYLWDAFNQMYALLPDSIKAKDTIGYQYPKYKILSNGRMEDAFRETAKRRRIPLVGLETEEEGFKALNFEMPLKQQALDLMISVHDFKNQINYDIQDSCYYYEDLNCLCSQGGHLNYQRPGDTTMRINRNARWMTKIPSLIQQQQMIIAVGAGHLCGDKGLVALLRKQGYTLKPIVLWNH